MIKVRKKGLGDWCENGSKDRDTAKMKTQLPSREVRGKLHESEEQQLVKQRKRMAVLRNDHIRRPSNSFNKCFAIFLNSSVSWLHMDDRPQSMCHA